MFINYYYQWFVRLRRLRRVFEFQKKKKKPLVAPPWTGRTAHTPHNTLHTARVDSPGRSIAARQVKRKLVFFLS